MMAPLVALFVLLTISFANCKTILLTSNGTANLANSKVINITNLPVSLGSKINESATDILVTSTMRIENKTSFNIPVSLENVTEKPVFVSSTEKPLINFKEKLSEPVEIVLPISTTDKSVLKEVSSIPLTNVHKKVVPVTMETKTVKPVIEVPKNDDEVSKTVSSPKMSSTTSTTVTTTTKPTKIRPTATPLLKYVSKNSNLQLKNTMARTTAVMTTMEPKTQKPPSQLMPPIKDEDKKVISTTSAPMTKSSNLNENKIEKNLNLLRYQRIRKKYIKSPMDKEETTSIPKIESETVDEVEIEEVPVMKPTQKVKSDKKKINMKLFVTPKGNVYEVLSPPESSFRSTLNDQDKIDGEYLCRFGNIAVYTDIPCDDLTKNTTTKKTKLKNRRKPTRNGVKSNSRQKAKKYNKSRYSNRRVPNVNLKPTEQLRPKISGSNGHSGKWIVQRKRQKIIRTPVRRRQQQYENNDENYQNSYRRKTTSHKQNSKRQNYNQSVSPKQQYLYVFNNNLPY